MASSINQRQLIQKSTSNNVLKGIERCKKKVPVLYNTLCCGNTYGRTSGGVLFLVLQILSNLHIIVSSCRRRLINATLYKNQHQITSGKLLKDARKWYHFRITHYVAEILTNKQAVAYYF